ncbi:FecR family protein [Fulvivirga ligni]|uniref:FecR family protein n=1 Tax=Fulvivirga ligni TaxID=2904246 RepID=UPI001F33B72A|nr:FecR family protein [Fulvivirga ligni]UII24278.1 FecR domain-containing protein [Fulvivirga ligni]
MEHLITKYLNNELSHEEWEELRQWLEKSDLNKTTLNNLKSFTSNIDQEADELEQVVWHELSALTNIQDRPLKPAVSLWRYARVAAALLIIGVIGIIAYQASRKEPVTYVKEVALLVKEAPLGTKVTTKLPDGTVVTLNAGSKISYPEVFSNESRRVQLTGEAFFEVTHQPQKPFYVAFANSEVKVLGTSFNIRTYQNEGTSSVSVATGKVSFKTSNDQLILTPLEMGVHNLSSSELLKKEVDELEAFGWTKKILYFNHAPFNNVIKELERWYGVEFEINGNFEPLGPFSGEFRNEPLSQVLMGLSHIYHFEFAIDDKKVTLNKITNQ